MEAKADVGDFVRFVQIENQSHIVRRIDARLEKRFRLPPSCFGLVVGQKTRVVAISRRTIVARESEVPRRRVRPASRRCLTIKRLRTVQTASI